MFYARCFDLTVRTGAGAGRRSTRRQRSFASAARRTTTSWSTMSHVSAEHARDLHGPAAACSKISARPTARRSCAASPAPCWATSSGRKAALENGDVIELGSGDQSPASRSRSPKIGDDTRVVAMRKIDELRPHLGGRRGNPRSLRLSTERRSASARRRGFDETLIASPTRSSRSSRARRTSPSCCATTMSPTGTYVPVMTRVRAPAAKARRLPDRCPSRAACFARWSTSAPRSLAADAPARGRPERVAHGRVRSAAPSASRSGRATTSSASSRSTTATRPACSTSDDVEVMAVLAAQRLARGRQRAPRQAPASRPKSG